MLVGKILEQITGITPGSDSISFSHETLTISYIPVVVKKKIISERVAILQLLHEQGMNSIERIRVI